MCIALISTAHPAYSLILLSNRDEFLNRPTAPASWWAPPHEHVLGGRDLLRPTQGTWLGVTGDGRIAVLTNFREGTTEAVGAQSRGGMINAFLSPVNVDHQTTEQFVKELVASGATQQVGGFSLVCGRIGEPLAVISNRVSTEKGISWVAGESNETVGLSNAAFGDKSWPKVTSGEELVHEALRLSIEEQEEEDQLVHRLLAVLSSDTLPREQSLEDGLDTRIHHLKETIFVPLLGRHNARDKATENVAFDKAAEKAQVLNGGRPADALGMSGLYGTQKQTVVLCRKDGRVRFLERTLFDGDSVPIEKGYGDAEYIFDIQK